MRFDERGLPKPMGKIELSLPEFETIFVKDFEPNERRRAIFEAFRDSLFEISKKIGFGFEIWIDGSFVERKTAPRDIDFLIVLDHDLIDEQIEKLVAEQLRLSAKSAFLDFYFLTVYPKNHPRHVIFQSNRAYWFDLFSRTRESKRTSKRHSKGFISIKFDQNEA